MTIAAPDVTMRVSGLSAASGGSMVAHPPDSRLFWVCPSLTPLTYTQVWSRFNASQQLRYNQLTALHFAELIAGFEAGGSRALAVLMAREDLSSELASKLRGFIEDEASHIARWRELLTLGDPLWRGHKPGRGLLSSAAGMLARRRNLMPLLFWLMLALEEHGVEISRRCVQMPRGELDALFDAAFRDHLRDEVRHVQLDVHLIEQFYATLPAFWRRVIAWTFRQLLSRVLLAPRKASKHVITRLIAEHPELGGMKPEIVTQLVALGKDSNYQEMMYSRKSTPQLFAMFDRFPEMHAISSVLSSYEPPRHG